MSGITHNAELRIPSNIIYLRSVRTFVKELAENIGFSQEAVNNIELVTDEIFSNAVEHGSKDHNSEIFVYCSVNGDMLNITISDKGQGKDFTKKLNKAWDKVIDNKVHIGTERGHGLLLARLLTDKMSIESNSAGGLDVHLTWFNRREKEYCIKDNRVCCKSQIVTNSADE